MGSDHVGSREGVGQGMPPELAWKDEAGLVRGVLCGRPSPM